jgi:hypothetical protein
MAGQDTSTLPLNPQSSKETTFKNWRDEILLREFQTVQAEAPLSSTQVYHLRQFADLAPEEYRCLNRIKSGIACPRLHSLPRNLRPQRTPHDRGRA